MIEAHQVEDFKIFVRALCFWAPPNGFCTRFPSGCRKCLQENEITMVDPMIALEFRGSCQSTNDSEVKGERI